MHFPWQAASTVYVVLLDGIQEDLLPNSFLFEYLSSQHICVPRPEKGGKPSCFPTPISCALVLFSERHQPEDIAGPVTCQLQVPAGGLTLGEVGRFHNLQAVSLHLPDFLKQGCTGFFFLCNECFVSMNHVWHVYAWRPRGKKKVMDLMELELECL